MNFSETHHPCIGQDENLRILTLPGSLRRNAYNRQLCHAAARYAPSGMTVVMPDELSSIPLFNEDLEATTEGGPEPVHLLRREVARADGLLIATPEYNQSIPGVLKNLVDWLSRGSNVLSGKPVTVIGASSGPWGTRLAQKELRHVLQATESMVMPGNMLFVRNAGTVFDKDELADPVIREKLSAILAAFAEWIKRVNPDHDQCQQRDAAGNHRASVDA